MDFWEKWYYPTIFLSITWFYEYFDDISKKCHNFFAISTIGWKWHRHVKLYNGHIIKIIKIEKTRTKLT